MQMHTIQTILTFSFATFGQEEQALIHQYCVQRHFSFTHVGPSEVGLLSDDI